MRVRRYGYGVVAGLLMMISGRQAAWAQAPLNFFTVTPCRVVDTRNPQGTFGGPSLQANSSRSFPIPASSCGIPANASGYSFNVTVVPAGGLAYLAMWPTGQPQPLVSTLNDPSGTVLANAAIVPAGTNGAVTVYATNTTDVILDINGYFVGESNSMTQSTALGTGALQSSIGLDNTAVGVSALQNTSTGGYNTAVGTAALSLNTTGSDNTAVGSAALQSNTAGGYNTAIGYYALTLNILGNGNTGVGYTALYNNNAGFNTAIGTAALANNTTGSNNTALGYFALSNTTTGGGNIAVGSGAGQNISGSGSYNIEIGNQGTSTDSNVIRLGTPGNQISTFIAGISNATVSGSAVLINSNGQLGIAPSSRDYKEDIQEMGTASDSLMLLRPVTFRYKEALEDGSKPLHYGLLAEEVAQVYPELVVTGHDGKIQSIEYHELPVLLLNEVQKQHKTIERQQDEIQSLKDRIASLEALLKNGPSSSR